MASFLSGSHKLLLFFLLLLSYQFFLATSIEFLVGGEDGWAVPPAKDSEKYNEWASENRFNVDDTVHFKYTKDSVMVVTEDEYKQCRSAKPIFYANNGDTIVQIDRPGMFYFISGVSGHCEKGLKMIIKVLEPHGTPSANNTAAPPQENNAVDLVSVSSSFFGMLFISFVSILFF